MSSSSFPKRHFFWKRSDRNPQNAITSTDRVKKTVNFRRKACRKRIRSFEPYFHLLALDDDFYFAIQLNYKKLKKKNEKQK